MPIPFVCMFCGCPATEQDNGNLFIDDPVVDALAQVLRVEHREIGNSGLVQPYIAIDLPETQFQSGDGNPELDKRIEAVFHLMIKKLATLNDTQISHVYCLHEFRQVY